MPSALFVIETPDGLVDFSVSITNRTEYTDGAIVAFYARFVRTKGADRPRREATDVFLLDDNHLPLVARLINAGRLTFPEHNEVLELFFESLPTLQRFDKRNLSLFDSALACLANDSSVATRFQTLARVERSRLSAADGGRSAEPHTARQTAQRKKTQKTDSSKPKVRRSHKDPVIGDVMHVNLQIEEE